MDIEKIAKRTGIHCIITDNLNDSLLVLKRQKFDDHDPNFWDLPGGGINKTEDIIDALKREVKEETNLSIDQANLIGAYTCDEGRLQLCAIARLASGEVKLSHEHSEYKWLSQEEFVNSKPSGLHLLAGQYFLETGKKIIAYNDLIKLSKLQ